MIAALILLPIVAGLITYGLKSTGPRRALYLRPPLDILS